MCGIVGYIGNGKTKNILIKGLQNLEYRGYDSAGIALSDTKNVTIIKEIGKVQRLVNKIKKTKVKDQEIGIAHTRWATNGSVSINNAHPHQVGKVTLVHNGIIENADKLKKELITKGYVFKSTTDSEVIAALLDNYLKTNSEEEAIIKLLKELQGSYALAIIILGNNYLYAIKNHSPLVIGDGKNEKYIASDMPAIASYTSKFFLLNDLEFAKISKEKIEIFDNLGKKINRKATNIDVTQDIIDKNGYQHFMLKEIMEEPTVLKNLIDSYLDKLDELDISKYEDVHIVACGSAMYAGMIGKILLEEKANVNASCEIASEYRYKKNNYSNKTLVILISQSGETADTIAALRIAKVNKQDTLAIVNVKNSTIDREADKSIYIEAGVEVAVATTKAYILQVAILALMAYVTAKRKSLLDGDENIEILNNFKKIPNLLEEVLKKEQLYKQIARKIYKNHDIFFIGRKLDYAISLEGSLKLKEISYIHSEAYPAGELKHGTISLIEKNLPVIAVMTDKSVKAKTMSNVKECEARGARLIYITTDALADTKNSLQVVVKDTDMLTQTLLVVPTLQMIAYYVALFRKCNIDKPKNLAKSVTVE